MHSYNQQNNSGGDSLLSIFSLGDDNNYDVTQAEESQAKKLKRKKDKRSKTILKEHIIYGLQRSDLLL